MARGEVFVGVDVSKHSLDVAVFPGGDCFQLGNDRAGLRALVSLVRRLKPRLVGFEATGGYEKGLLGALSKAKLPASRINPQRVREFAKACGVLAKNDRVDARLIARFCATLEPRLTVSSARTDALAALVTTRSQIVEDITRVGNQAGQGGGGLLGRLASQRLRQLAVHLKTLDLAITKMVAEDPDFARDDALMQSMCGVGPVLSHTLLALMPELGKLENTHIAALAGVAPFDRDSGKFKGKRTIGGGRQPVRDKLFMAAMTASTKNRTLKVVYDRLIAAGKAPKVALVALMRKIITTLNVMLRERQNWRTPAAA